MKTSRIEFIKRAHSAACSDWKKEIETEFPKLFPKSEYKKGDWVYWSGFSSCLGIIGDKCDSYSDSYKLSYTINGDGKYTSCSKNNLRPATDKEVEEALDKQADKIGYKEGDNIGNFNGLKNETITSDSKSFSGGLLFRGGCCVFEKGKWATIIGQPKKLTVEEVEKELGYKVEIISNKN